jgi:hypothetical protein
MNDRIPTADNAAKLITDVLISVRNDGATVDQQLSNFKAKLFDEEFVRPQDRQAVLKKVNKGMGVNWSMNQVKRADGAMLEQVTQINAQRGNDKPLIPVDELHGSSTVKGATSAEMAPQLTATERLLAANQTPAATAQSTAQVVELPVTPAAPAAEQVAPAADTAAQTSSTSQENTNMKLVQDITAANNTNTAPAADGAAVDFDMFIAGLTHAGANTPELRKELWVGFITQDAMIHELWKGHVPAEGVNSDQQIYNFVAARKPVGDAFVTYLASKANTGIEATAEAKSRFSFTGDRDEGIRTSWVAAGSAVIGGGIEMFARGGLTLGSAVGTVLGAGASFFGGELVDEHIEGDFGRYVAGGTLGLILGAGGSALGRAVLPGAPLLGSGNTMNAELPAPSAPVFQTPAGVSASLAGL